MKDFNGKTAVVTGGASGIGRAMGELFLAKGMNVVLADIEQGALDATVEALDAGDGHCIGVVTDVSKAEDVQRLADAVVAKFGAIHIACNNAGVFAGGLLWEQSVADFQWQLDVNVWGVIHGIRTFVPIMAAQDGECHIVNTASMAAVTAMPYSGIYHMTKHAVLAMSESLHHELSFHVPNVKVSVLCPEAINTGIAASERNRPSGYSRAGDIVESDARALVSQALADSVAGGIGPEVMAQRVFDAIVEERFYILSEEAWRESANVRLEDVRLGRNPTFAPPVSR
ncbi:MAG: SDR family NAD(P)-dependent oxidoreductase [Halioglobus sp.]|nr:SDR family NAD(P)-dependent oxidoreductase [Halioglobus sp.]